MRRRKRFGIITLAEAMRSSTPSRKEIIDRPIRGGDGSGAQTRKHGDLQSAVRRRCDLNFRSDTREKTVAMGIRSFLRCGVVLLTIVSWVAISNHCALAAFSAPNAPAESCPMHSKPAKQKQGSGRVCCKILRAASTPATVKAAVPQLQMLSPEQLQFSVVLLLFPPSEPLLPGLDTGPPGPDSFAESVLQRSILAHAPPSLG